MPKDQDFDEKEMSFLDHLEELRWHLLRAFGAILLFTIVAFANKKLLFHDIILGPARPDFFTYRAFCRLGEWLQVPSLCIDRLNFILQSRTLMGQFTTHLTVSVACGLILSFPYVFWEIWRFIKPGLKMGERSATGGAVFSVSLLFISGILFGYYLVAPMSINFLANYTVDDSIANEFDLSSYMGTLVMMVLGCGAIFQLPMVIYVLSKIGLITPQIMRNVRRYAVVVILVVAAVITPSPDIFSQLLVAIPLYFLYELSIFISAAVQRKREKEQAEALKG